MKGNNPFFCFSFRRFMQNLIRKNDFNTYRNSKQYWKITWLVYKSYMFRPENIMLIGAHVALCSTLAPLVRQPEKFNGNKEIEVVSDNYLKQSVADAAEEQTYKEVMGMVSASEYLEQLEVAKEIENENNKLYKEALGMATKDEISNKSNINQDMINIDEYNGFETEINVSTSENLFEQYKQELANTHLENGSLSTENEKNIFKNNIANLDHSSRILVDQEILLNQSIVYQIQDFFYSFTQRSKDKDPVVAQVDNKEYLTKEYTHNNLYRSFLTKIYDPLDYRLNKYSKSEGKRQKKCMDKRDDDLFNNLFDGHDGLVDELDQSVEQAKNTNIFIENLLHMQDEYLESLEEQKIRSKEVELKFAKIKELTPQYYSNIMDYLHSLKYSGLNSTGDILKIYEMIPNHDKELKSGFTQFLLKRVSFFKHILNPDKKNNFVVENESLFSKMLDNVSGTKNVLPKYSSYIVMMRKLSDPVNSNKIKSMEKRVLRKYNARITREKIHGPQTKRVDIKGKYEIHVPWTFFCELLKKTFETGQVGDSLRLLKSIPKEYDAEKVSTIDLGDYISNISVHHKAMAELHEYYDDWLAQLIEELKSLECSNDSNKQKLYNNRAFREAIIHFNVNANEL